MGEGIISGKSTFLQVFWLELGKAIKYAKNLITRTLRSYYVKIMAGTSARTLVGEGLEI